MILLSLDLSKRSTGWAAWDPEWEKPRYGHWVLGSEFTSDGQTYCKLHQNLLELRQLVAFGRIYHEEAINPAKLTGHTNIATLRLAQGLVSHVESFAYATRCGVRSINVANWRRDFVGALLVSEAQAAARRKRKLSGKKASATDELKELTKQRCRQLGFAPKNNDEGDALGILDYACAFEGITPPWRANEVLRPPMEAQA